MKANPARRWDENNFEFDGDRNQSAIGISLPMIQISYYSLALSDAQQKYDNRRRKWVQEQDDAD